MGRPRLNPDRPPLSPVERQWRWRARHGKLAPPKPPQPESPFPELKTFAEFVEAVQKPERPRFDPEALIG